jgi:flagellar hook-basal body complex protein FliE
MRIDSLNLARMPEWGASADSKSGNGTFADVLKKAISDVQSLEAANQQNNYLLATGGMENLHNVMIDLEKADIALQFTLQVRNRIMEAYHEIMRMQL